MKKTTGLKIIIFIVLLCFFSCSTIPRPDWMANVPKNQEFKFYVGRAYQAKDKKEGSIIAIQDAYYQVIRDNFGIKTKLYKKLTETLSTVDFEKKTYEASSEILFRGLTQEGVFFERENRKINSWILFKISKKSITEEVERLRHIAQKKEKEEKKLELTKQLIDATRANKFKLAKQLFNEGANPSLEIDDQGTALYFAVLKNKSRFVKLFLSDKKNNLSSYLNSSSNNLIMFGKNISGLSLLSIASHKGHYDIVKMLVKRGAEPNHLNGENRSPLFFAVRGRNLKVVKFLLVKGADPNLGGEKIYKEDGYGSNSLGNLAGSAIYDDGVVTREEIEIARALIKKGAYINTLDLPMYTRSLTSKIKDETIPRKNKTVKKLKNELELFNLFLENGADPNAEGLIGMPIAHNVIDICKYKISEKMMKTLLEKGVRFDIGNKFGLKPMNVFAMYDCGNKMGEMILANKTRAYLIFNSNKSFAFKKFGHSPLPWAVQSNNVRLVKLFLKYGADPHEENIFDKVKNGGHIKSETPWELAESLGYKKILNIFKGRFIASKRTYEQQYIPVEQFSKKRCDGGNIKECTRLGVMEERKGNTHKAITLYKKACSDGHGVGCSLLGLSYFRAGNRNEAKRFLRKACENGYKGGCKALERLY